MKIGIVGATGEVGRTMLRVLEESEVLVSELRLFASSKSAGTEIRFWNKPYIVEELTEDSMREKFDYLLFSAGGDVSRKFAPIAAEAGNTVIDNSSAFRMYPDIPLIVPEINKYNLMEYNGIIANPNCSTIQLLLALNLVKKNFGINEIVVSTYQAVSGAGNKGIQELNSQLEGNEETNYFPKKIMNNVIPKIGTLCPNGFTDEEMKMINETRKIFGDGFINVYPTTVRVPVYYGHSESVFFRTRQPATIERVRELLSTTPNVVYTDELITPMDIAGSDITYVSRLRQTGDREFLMWVVADNVRVGAATNAVRILEAHAEINKGILI